MLLDQAQAIQPDAMSWFQVGLAYEKLGRVPESIDAYEHALMLDPAYDLAMFNLGGVFWNSGDREQALLILYRTRFLGHKFVSCGGPE